MLVQERIEAKLQDALEPVHLEVINESSNHSVPPNSETHFKVIVVSLKFDGVPLLKRHQLVNATLAEELEGPVHALSIVPRTLAQWESTGGSVPKSPDCHGGSKADAN